MTRTKAVAACFHVTLIVCLACTGLTQADPFTSSYTDGDTWNVIYGTGFRPWNNDGQDPTLVEDDLVPLSRFEFFFSEYDISLDENDHDGDGLGGDVVEATDIRLAIVNNFFVDLQTLTTTSPAFVGLSTNTIASTTGMATGDPLRFDFTDTDLVYSGVNWYAAILVNVGEDTGSGAPLTPVLVPTILATFQDDPNTPEPDLVLPPATNYGEADPTAPIDYFLSVTNYLHTDEFGTYFDAWDGSYADANFVAYYDTEFPAGLLGDYNENNVIDAADYTTWRDAMTAGLAIPNDPTGGIAEEADFTYWRAHFGEVLGTGSGAAAGVATHAVPEPGSAVLACFAGIVAWWGRSRHARQRLCRQSRESCAA
jgi:hypothetical protein